MLYHIEKFLFVFEGNVSLVAYNGGTHPYVGSHIVTIDISTNKFVYFDDLLCIEELEDALSVISHWKVAVCIWG